MLRVLEFNSQTLKSGVVVESNDAPEGCALLFVRGAPNVVKDLVRPASVPKDFNQVHSSNPRSCILALLRYSLVSQEAVPYCQHQVALCCQGACVPGACFGRGTSFQCASSPSQLM